MSIVMAAIALHNYLLIECPNIYNPNGYADFEDENHVTNNGLWRNIGENIQGWGI